MEPSPDPASPPLPPRRARTILGRLTSAVREQNWFAVGLEVVIVVLGVVIGFQVTAWGQGRADRVKERAYLDQLAQDLRQTEELILWANSESQSFDAATEKLVQAYFTPTPPPVDSVLRWRHESQRYRPLIPVTGTADALIASGDLALIRNDSLRSAITAWVPFVKGREAGHESDTRLWWAEWKAVASRYDPGDIMIRTMDASAIDSTDAASSYSILPSGERRSPFPVDVEAMLADQEAYGHLRAMLEHKSGMYWERRFVLGQTRLLLEQVEAELNR